MRIDKFMKVSRIIKRRTVANDACSGGRVSINGKVAKPGDKLKVGDVIEISFGDKLLKARVLDLNEHATKETASQMYEIL
ncbi:MAG: RNA-binding S4 domain-containing protein [Monoglobales bacterium]